LKIILSSQIDHLNFENGETIRITRAICAMHSTIAQLIIICPLLYLKEKKNDSCTEMREYVLLLRVSSMIIKYTRVSSGAEHVIFCLFCLFLPTPYQLYVYR
jgi:hypothetical protein